MRKSTFFAATLGAALLLSACSGGGNSFTGDSVFSGGGSSSGSSSSTKAPLETHSDFYGVRINRVEVDTSVDLDGRRYLYISRQEWNRLVDEGVLNATGGWVTQPKKVLSKADIAALLAGPPTYDYRSGDRKSFSIEDFGSEDPFVILAVDPLE